MNENEWKEPTKLNITDYLSDEKNLSLEQKKQKLLSVKQAQDNSNYFVSFTDQDTAPAYSYIRKSIKDRADHYNLPDGKTPVFYNESIRYDALKDSLVREISRMNEIKERGCEEVWWSSTLTRFSAWLLVSLAHLDNNKVVTATQLSCITGKSIEASRKCLREAEDRGYVTSQLVNGTNCYKTTYSTVNKYYNRIRARCERTSVSDYIRLLNFKNYVDYENEFVKSFQSKKDD